jgi:hypothetical protein
MRIQVSGIEATKKQVLEDYQTYIRELADTTLKAAQKFTPVRTGTARDGWQAKVSEKNTFVVSNEVPYVPFLDKGTRKMKPANRGRGIIGPTLTEIKGKQR